MLRTLCPVILVLAVFAVVQAAPVKEKKAQTIKGWGTVIDPDRDCKVQEMEGKVTITVPVTHHDLTYVNVHRSRVLVRRSRLPSRSLIATSAA
jgi:hypothetical protein